MLLMSVIVQQLVEEPKNETNSVNSCTDGSQRNSDVFFKPVTLACGRCVIAGNDIAWATSNGYVLLRSRLMLLRFYSRPSCSRVQLHVEE
jgi:hypothetical protein